MKVVDLADVVSWSSFEVLTLNRTGSLSNSAAAWFMEILYQLFAEWHTEAPATNAELTWALAATERIDETNPEIKRLTAYLQLCWQQDSSVYTRESATYKLPWKIIGGHEFLHIPESVHRAGPLSITSEYLANNMRALELRAPNCNARGIVEAALACEALYGRYETFGIKKLTHDLTRDFMDILYNLVCPMALFLPHRTSDLLDGAVAAYITIDPPGADFKNPMWSKVDWAPERIFRLMDHPEWLVTGQLQANERVEYTRTLQKCQAIFNKHYKRGIRELGASCRTIDACKQRMDDISGQFGMNVPVTTHPMYAAWTSVAQFLRDARYSTIEASQIMSIIGEKPNQIALRHLDKEFRVRILSEVFRDAIQRDLQSNDGKS